LEPQVKRCLSFIDTGKTVRRYYTNGDDAIEMAREL